MGLLADGDEATRRCPSMTISFFVADDAKLELIRPGQSRECVEGVVPVSEARQ
jgi:Cu/Ag efflux protein CusF